MFVSFAPRNIAAIRRHAQHHADIAAPSRHESSLQTTRTREGNDRYRCPAMPRRRSDSRSVHQTPPPIYDATATTALMSNKERRRAAQAVRRVLFRLPTVARHRQKVRFCRLLAMVRCRHVHADSGTCYPASSAVPCMCQALQREAVGASCTPRPRSSVLRDGHSVFPRRLPRCCVTRSTRGAENHASDAPERVYARASASPPRHRSRNARPRQRRPLQQFIPRQCAMPAFRRCRQHRLRCDAAQEEVAPRPARCARIEALQMEVTP